MHDVISRSSIRLGFLNSSFFCNKPYSGCRNHLAHVLLPYGNWGSRKQNNNSTLAIAIVLSNTFFLSLSQVSPVFCQNLLNCSKLTSQLASKVNISAPLQFLTKHGNSLNKPGINLICKSELETSQRNFFKKKGIKKQNI